MCHAVVQGHNAHQGFGQRHHDLEKHLEGGAAVDDGRFLHLGGDAVGEEGPADDEVIGGDACGDDQGPAGVQEAQVFHRQVGGDHAAAEIHGEGDEEHHDVPPYEVALGQGVGRRKGQGQVEQGAEDGVEDGVQVAGDDAVVLEHRFVGVQGGRFGVEPDLSRRHQVGV